MATRERESEVVLARCPSCDGLKVVTVRRARDKKLCVDCRSGRVVYRGDFFAFWRERFDDETLQEMARHIFG